MQAAVPISAAFTAPFCIRSDPDEDDICSGHRFLLCFHDALNIHAGVCIRAGDHEGMERLCRYASRAPLSLERLSLLEDGRVAYRLRKVRKNGATHLVMTPVELLAKIAAVVPPPRFPLIRFAGVLAPGSSWRASVVPAQNRVASAHACGTSANAPAPEDKVGRHDGTSAGVAVSEVAAQSNKTTLAHADGTVANAPAAEDRAGRTGLGSGVVRTTGARIDWASLMKRVFREDVLACPCGGRRRVIADIQNSEVIVAILNHLGLPTEAPRIAPARDPTFGFE